MLAVVGHVVALRRHGNRWIVALAALGVALVLNSLWLHYVEALVYIGLAALVAATVWSAFAVRRFATCELPPAGVAGEPGVPKN